MIIQFQAIFRSPLATPLTDILKIVPWSIPYLTINPEALEKSLSTAIGSMRSLDEIRTWLMSQPGVKSVHLEDYILKSYPPQRDFTVELSAPDGSTVTRVVNIFDLGNQQFKFHKLRDR